MQPAAGSWQPEHEPLTASYSLMHFSYATEYRNTHASTILPYLRSRIFNASTQHFMISPFYPVSKKLININSSHRNKLPKMFFFLNASIFFVWHLSLNSLAKDKFHNSRTELATYKDSKSEIRRCVPELITPCCVFIRTGELRSYGSENKDRRDDWQVRVKPKVIDHY